MPTWIYDIGFFGLLFFVLVFIHELGHFLMAKWVGIRVECFAIGMGPSLFSFKKGDTEYKWGLLPLGGYVKMSGDDPSKEYSEEDKRVGFLSKTPPQKLLVVFGGPVFNLILPIFLFAAMLALGIPNLDPVIGTLELGKPAAIAGLQSGDRIVEINGAAIKKFSQIEGFVEKAKTSALNLKIERENLITGENELIDVAVTPVVTKTKNKFGQDVEAPRLGVSPEFSAPLIFFESDKSVIAQSGAKQFDRILKIGNVRTLTQAQFLSAVENLSPGEHTFELERNRTEKLSIAVTVPEGGKSVMERLGLFSAELVLGKVEEGSPAAKAGLQTNDRLISINSQPLKSFEQVGQIVRASDGKPVQVQWSRGGELHSATLAAEKTTIDDPMLGRDNPLAREPVYRIGIASAKLIDTSLSIEQSSNPIQWVKRGVTETWNMATSTIEALVKLFTGQLSIKLLGSPIMIYKVAGNSYRVAGGGYFGWISFFSNLALLSITLGLVNLLPIPVLDGGHATFFLIEWIRRKPVSLRFMEMAMRVGLFLLACLFVTVLMNDIHRYQLFEPILKLFR